MNQQDIFPHEEYVFVSRITSNRQMEVVLVREPTDRLVVQKRIRLPRPQGLAENPFTEVMAYDAVQQLAPQPPDPSVLLGHPNVLRKLNHYTTPDGHFFVITTEYATGDEYFNYLEDSDFTPLQVRRHFIQICRGLRHLHLSGWSHLDISTENILMKGHKGTPDQIPVVMDFGMALPIGQPVQGMRGKPYYAAPELYRLPAVPCNPAFADMWSLGVLLFIMLTGMPLFEAGCLVCPKFRWVCRRQQDPGPQNGLFRMLSADPATFATFQDGSLDLLQRLVHIDPMQRISLDGVLAHPFCTLD